MNVMMRNVVMFILVSFIVQAVAQEITVSGKATGSQGDLIRVLVYADQFSMLEKSIAETYTDKTGAFALKTSLPKTTFGFLAMNLEKGECYLTPGGNYVFDIVLPDNVTQGSVFDKIPLQFSLKVENDGGLQSDIEQFNQLYNNFVYENAQAIYRSRSKKVIDDFKAKVNSHFDKTSNQYFKDYVHFAFVSLDWLSKRMSDAKVMEALVLQPVLYQNIQYTEFFKTYFDNYLELLANKHYDEMVFLLNQSKTDEGLIHFIQRDSLLRTNDQVTELVMMLLMSKFYYVADVQKTALIQKYKQISSTSQFGPNREIALHFIEKLTQLDYGFPAPEFELINLKGASVNLQEYRGKFVLLDFVSSGCQVCVSDLVKLVKIQTRFADTLDVITLVVNQSGEKASLKSLDEYGWTFLSVPKTSLLPEQYHVRTFPTYVLINPDGSMAYATMPMPDENMELMISRFIARFSHH